jgi:hypothetical protein
MGCGSEVAPSRRARRREFAGSDARKQIGPDAGNPEPLGDDSAQRRRPECGEQDIRAGSGGCDQSFPELLKEVDEHGSGRSPGRRRCPRLRELEGIARQGTVCHAASVHQVGEGIMGGDRNLVAGILQPLPESCVGRDVASGAGGHDQYTHPSLSDVS